MRKYISKFLCALLAFNIISIQFIEIYSAEAGNFYITEKCNSAFSMLYERSENVTYSNRFSNAATAYNEFIKDTYAMGAGSNELIWDFEGGIRTFYIQFLYDKTILRSALGITDLEAVKADIISRVSIYTSADGVAYEKKQGFGTHGNCDMKVESMVSDSKAAPAVITGNDNLLGMRIENYINPNSCVTGSSDRYLKLVFDNSVYGEGAVCMVQSFFMVNTYEPSAAIKDANLMPASDNFILEFNTDMDAATLKPQNITISEGLSVTGVTSADNGLNRQFKVQLSRKTVPSMTYNVGLSPDIVSKLTGSSITTRNLLFNVSKTVFIHENCIDFSNVEKKSDGIVISSGQFNNYPNTFVIPKGSSSITFKYDGSIDWFYYQMIVKTGSASVINTNNIKMYSSKDNMAFKELISGDTTDYQLRSNITLRTVSSITAANATLADTSAISGYQGVRMINHPIYNSNWNTMDVEVRYIKITFDNIPDNTSLYFIESISKTTQLPYVSATAQAYSWDNAKIGGGGFVTGLVFHPAVSGLAYARTDVGGLYRWDKPNRKWIPLNDMFGLDKRNCYGIDGVCIDPNNPDVVYIYVGMYWYRNGGGVYKSADRGESWTKTSLSVRSDAGGSPERVDGECLAVDPKNSNIVYCGTRYDGLFVSRDAGETWSNVSQIPRGIDINESNQNDLYADAGIRTLAYDPASPLADNGATSVMYAGVHGKGVYKTSDGGASWSLMSGSPLKPKRLKVFESEIFVTSGYYAEVVSESGFFQYKNNTWSNITPEVAQDYPLNGFSVTTDSLGNRVMFLSAAKGTTASGPLYKKTGDENWQTVFGQGEALAHTDLSEFMSWSNMRSLYTAACEINPFPEFSEKIELWLTDGRGIYQNKDVMDNNSKFTAEVQGIEECVVNIVTSPPNGSAQLFTGIWDFGGYRHTNVKAYTAQNLAKVYKGTNGDSFWHGQTNAFDYCEEDSNYIAAYTQSSNQYDTGCVVVSSDNGVTWYDNGWSKTNGYKGDVALSCGKNINGVPTIVGIAYGATTVARVSEDFGKTWSKVSGLSEFISSNNDKHAKSKVLLAADRVNKNYFYFYDYKKGQLYISSDGGKSFSKSPYAITPQTTANSILNNNIEAKPNTEGEVWLSAYDSGLYKSTDYGQTLTKLKGIDMVEGFSFGALVPDTQTVSIFILGAINNKRGLYRSDNNGQSWILVSDDKHQLGNFPGCVEGDRRTYGRVYVGTGGRGVLMGEINTVQGVLVSGTEYQGEIKNGKTYTSKALLQNSDEKNSRNGIIVMVLYNAEGALKEISYNIFSVPPDTSKDISVSIRLDDFKDYSTVYAKTFVWNNLQKLTPLCDPW